MRAFFRWLIRLYQRYISPLKKPCCRFYPTCSSYALEAFTKRGFFPALFLTIWRILRCNPFCKGGLDPVPEARRSKQEQKSVIDSKRKRANNSTNESEH